MYMFVGFADLNTSILRLHHFSSHRQSSDCFNSWESSLYTPGEAIELFVTSLGLVLS
jgi:hypothetical protein